MNSGDIKTLAERCVALDCATCVEAGRCTVWIERICLERADLGRTVLRLLAENTACLALETERDEPEEIHALANAENERLRTALEELRDELVEPQRGFAASGVQVWMLARILAALESEEGEHSEVSREGD